MTRFKWLVMAPVLLVAMAASFAAERDVLVGNWRLVSFEREYQSAGEREYPMGKVPTGYILFLPEGRMAVVITAEGRKPPVTDQDRAGLFNTSVAYTGVYRVEGDKWITPYAVCPTTENYQCSTCHILLWDPDSNAYVPKITGDCTVCHGSVSHSAEHEHVKIDSITCQQCHQPNVVDEHAAHSLSCNVCHGSTDATVINAISKGKGPVGQDVYCYDCHGVTDHTSAHDHAKIPYQDCGSCHATNVVTEHTKYGLNCSVCHKTLIW